jgi:replicative DNA helicase
LSVQLSNPEIEREVLLSIVLYAEDYRKYINVLDENDFTVDIHKKIVNVLKKFEDEKKAVDVAIIATEIPTIIDFINNSPPPSLAAFDDYVHELKQLKIKRDLYRLGHNIQKAINKNLKNETVITAIRRFLDSFSVTTDAEHIKDVVIKAIQMIEDNYRNKDKRIHLEDLNKLNDMVNYPEMTVIGARPGTGKTAFGLKIAYEVAKYGRNVYFVTREMTNEQVVIRLLSKIGRVDGDKIRKGTLENTDWRHLTEALAIINKLNIYFDNHTAYIEDLHLKLANQKVDFLVIDYLQLLRTREKAENRVQEISKITAAIKTMNLDLKIPIIVLSQLNREGEKEPTLKTLREGGTIEQDFDNVVFLHTTEEEMQKEIRKVKLIIAKQRNGPPGKYNIWFQPKYMEFYEEEKFRS